MHDSLLRKLDLNLLVALDVLLSVDTLAEASVELGVNRAAVRYTLRRLREVFDDQLLIEEPDALVQTAKAQVLAEPLDKALTELRHVMGTCASFQPERARHHFLLACDDFSTLLLMPRLLEALAELAPNLTLEVLPSVAMDTASALEAGRIDLVLQQGLKPRVGIVQRQLLSDQLACATRHQHPAIDGELDRETFYALSHLAVMAVGDLYHGGGFARLAELDDRHVALKLASLHAVPEVLSRSELVLTAPRRCLELWAERIPLDIFPAPLPLPSYALFMAWQKRAEHHPAHRWLRATLSELADAVN